MVFISLTLLVDVTNKVLIANAPPPPPSSPTPFLHCNCTKWYLVRLKLECVGVSSCLLEGHLGQVAVTMRIYLTRSICGLFVVHFPPSPKWLPGLPASWISEHVGRYVSEELDLLGRGPPHTTLQMPNTHLGTIKLELAHWCKPIFII